MIAVRHRLICGGKQHTITLQPSGRLVFHNHKTEELERYMCMAEMGGRACLCAQVLWSWRKSGMETTRNGTAMPNRFMAGIPPALLVHRQNQLTHMVAWRLLRRRNERRGDEANAVIDKEWRSCLLAPQHGAYVFSTVFMQVIANQLRARFGVIPGVYGLAGNAGTALASIGGVTVPTRATNFIIKADVVAKDDTRVIMTLPLGTTPATMTVVRTKNVKKALYLAVDRAEQFYLEELLKAREKEEASKALHDIDESVARLHNKFFAASRLDNNNRLVSVGMTQAGPLVSLPCARLVMAKLDAVATLMEKGAKYSTMTGNPSTRADNGTTSVRSG